MVDIFVRVCFWCAEIIAKLDANKYQRLDWMAEACDGNAFDPEHDVEDVRLLTGQALVTYGQLRKVREAGENGVFSAKRCVIAPG